MDDDRLDLFIGGGSHGIHRLFTHFHYISISKIRSIRFTMFSERNFTICFSKCRINILFLLLDTPAARCVWHH